MRTKNLFLFLSAIFFSSSSLLAGGWIEKANFGGDARHRSTAFSIGSRGYIGLGHVNSIVDILYEDFWEYDPGTNSWTQKANFGGGQRYHAAGFAIGNYAYVGTGRQPGGTYTDDFWRYDPVNNLWTPIANFPGSLRRGAVAFVINGIGYVGTGQTYSGNSADFFKYDPSANSWSSIPSLPGPGRTSSVAFSIGTKGYVGTGQVSGGTYDFYEYNSITNSWTQKADVSNIIRQEAAGFAINGKGYILTGDNYSSGDNYGDMWEYDPALNMWTQLDDFDGLARRYLVALVINNVAYAGLGTNGTNFKDFWEYDPLLSVLEKNKDLLQLSIYPNPSTENITIDLTNVKANESLNYFRISIYDFTGKIIYTVVPDADKTFIQVNSFSRGIYFCALSYRDRFIKGEKIILQ